MAQSIKDCFLATAHTASFTSGANALPTWLSLGAKDGVLK